MSGRHGSPEERFARYAVRLDPSECWEWAGARSTRGYGELSAPGRAPIKAHRMAWELEYGPVPAGLWVLHHCDNTACINPAHLYLGTHADNMRDMRLRGRHAYRINPESIIRGERAGAAKLTESAVREIRRLYEEGCSRSSLGREFGVSRQAISHILEGRTWTHVLRHPEPQQLELVAGQ